ncbi:transcriptional regulator, BadM/Rrf2 family [Richelia sinica FACHB-800]|jgi:Rrf2 family protein|uniref:Transcriptional regulator, BadM/Rrf2 family n=1 Tax=Richelia sinica FACHB-800 TaxID=1357546 RepID=A0A975Y667_9NOST|nr:Rrf2 family transcriptional regulator [Richelia sinica]MBD2664041.1 Rrf2 family transcriptional regulator [Richelia sinica FACHB-800]QXE24944.1 transcriptional regulator, BadM/Rrf2 family [Richelia sinica FACHB-800]
MYSSILNTDLNNSQSYALLDLSAKVEYALLALLELAIHHDQKVPLTMNEIAAKQPIPERYLEQILTHLRRAGVVQSQRGSKGGFLLLREPWQITLLEIVTLVEGERKEKESAETRTIEKTLVLEIWEQANASAIEVLRGYTLQDLCQEIETRTQNNPMYYI